MAQKTAISQLLLIGSAVALATACGQRADTSATKVVGGHVAGDRPFMAGMVLPDTGDSIFCGGTFIAPDVVMTAAHCVADGWDGLRVSGGQHTSDGLTTDKTATAKTVVVHEKYDADKNDNDIALVFLKKDELSKFPDGKVTPAVPSDDLGLPDRAGKAMVSGWGVEHEGDWNLPHELMEVEVPIIANDKCKSAGDDYGKDINDDQVCAGDWDKGGVDTCQGDSGGPMFVEQDGKIQVIGITSWGLGCAQAQKPGVYTRVAKYTDWISKTVKAQEAL